MKKITILPILFTAITVLIITSCKKEGTTIDKVIHVDMDANTTYSGVVPSAGDADDVMKITQQASHFTTSSVTTDAGGNILFTYTPASDYTGTDEVHISNTEGQHHGSSHSGWGGGCHHHDDVTNYIYKINIKGVN